ncbi:hypothetical protein [Aeromonas sp. Y301-2]|uniref:hypothetical protein n=1 Tax=unclassified Aeromonas TaxID=257493 RepID=UPI0022E7CC44|nr:hypothetical protein [Aeromonas sp. Y301-2]
MAKAKPKAVTALQLLNKLAFRHERVAVPELGEDAEIIVREMPVSKLLEYQLRNFDQTTGQPLADNPFQWMVSLLVACMVDEEGNSIATQDDVPQLMESLPMSVIDRLLPAAKRLNRMGELALVEEKNDKGQSDQAAGDQVSDRSA